MYVIYLGRIITKWSNMHKLAWGCCGIGIVGMIQSAIHRWQNIYMPRRQCFGANLLRAILTTNKYYSLRSGLSVEGI